jgi:hypothetical protein
MEATTSAPTSHGGIMFPLDMFRPTTLAAALAEVLLGKVRNILDATVEICRHPGVPLVLARIHGTVVGDDPAEFWRENQDLALVVSQITPRQCFVYFARSGDDRREGFLVAQRGQAIAADDSNRDDTPGKGGHWPVARLCEQMRISPLELAEGFPGGPRIELSLMEPRGNDQALLMTLAGQPPGGEPEPDEAFDDEPPPPPPPSRGTSLTQGFGAPPPAASPPPPAGARPAAPARAPALNAAEDAKRRATEKAAEQQEISQRGSEAARKLRLAEDDLGVVVALPIELSETDILRPFQISRVDGNAPDSLPADVRDRLQGRSLDFAVVVEFLSEVFLENQPLGRPKFEERAQVIALGGAKVQALEVHAPRLGPGTLVRLNGRNVFVSRHGGSSLPADLILSLLNG